MVGAAGADDDERLEDAVGLDGSSEGFESLGVEGLARLVRVGGDFAEWEVEELGELFVFERGGVEFFVDEVGGNEAGEAAAESFVGGQ